MADPANRDPAEGKRDSDKNPEQEAENPGGRPTDTVKKSAPPPPAEPQGQQGGTHPQAPQQDR